MSANNVALLRMAGRLVDVSGRSGQAHFEDQIRGAWSAALADIPRHLASDPVLAEQFAQQLALAASKPQHATMLFALIDDGGKDTIVGEFFQNAEIEHLAKLGGSNPDILRLLAKVSSGPGGEPEPETGAAPLIEFGLASVAVPAGEPAAGSAVVTETHVFPCAWEGPDSPGVLRDLVRIHEALTRTGSRKPLERYGQPQIDLWLASQPNGRRQGAGVKPAATPEPAAPVATATQAPTASLPAAAMPAPHAPARPAPPPMTPVLPVAKPVQRTPPPVQTTASQQSANEPARAKKDPFETFEANVEPRTGNRVALLAGVGGALALALAAGIYFLMGNPSKPAQTPTAPTATAPVTPYSAPATPAESAPTPSPRSSQPSNAAAATPAGSVIPANATKPPSETETKAAASTVPASTNSTPSTPPVDVTPTPQAATPAAQPAPETGRRAAALDALGLPGQESEEKRRNALKALTGQ